MRLRGIKYSVYSLEPRAEVYCLWLKLAISTSIDLFSLYVSLFHCRPPDAILANGSFQMSSYARANVRITYEKRMRISRDLNWVNKTYKLKRFQFYSLDHICVDQITKQHYL